MYTGLHVKYPLFLSDLNETRIFSLDFRTIIRYQISWKSILWKPSCSVLTDRRTHGQTQIWRSYVNKCPTSCNNMQLPHSSVANLATLEWSTCTTKWLVPVAVTTVLCTPDDGCGRHPKHVEWSCSKIKYRLRIVASRWTFINIDLWCTEPWT